MLERINVNAYRDRLQAIWDLQHGRYSALAIVFLLEALRSSLEELRLKVGVGAWPIDKSSQSYALRGWDKEFSAWSKRIDSYADDIPPCWGDGECWSQDGYTEETYLDVWVAKPILEGVWPPDWYLNVPKGGMPDATQGASLWNQLIEVANLQEELRSTSTHIGEWMLYVERELSESAPGEDPTLRDKVTAVLRGAKNAILEGAAKIGSGFVVGAVVVAGALGAYAVWRARR